MVTKTAREILEAAKYLAGVRNSKMADFFQVVNVFNNIYKDIYRRITSINSSYLVEYEITSKEWQIPKDVFTVFEVYHKNNDNTVIPIQRGTYSRQCCYNIVNNKIRLYNINIGSIYCKCVLLPETITCPDDAVIAPANVTSEQGYLDNDNYYFTNDNIQYVWNISNNEVNETEAPNKQLRSSTFNEKHVDVYPEKGYVIIDNRDATSTFIVEDDVKIVSACFCDPYALVSYNNGHTYLFKTVSEKVFDTDTNKEEIVEHVQWTRWNPDSYTGHQTLAKVVALDANDNTGRGVVYLDLNDNTLKFGSFVPDTIIAAPSNILFTYLEASLAAYLISITGNTNDYLIQNILPNAEQELFNSMSTDQYSPIQMKNVVSTNSYY